MAPSRYSRATGMLGGSRQPSIDRTSRPSETPDRTQRPPSVARGTTPQPAGLNPAAGATKNGSVLTGSGAASLKMNAGNPSMQQSPPFEEILLRKRNLGQDIIPSPNQPKRTESLFIPGQQNPPAAKVQPVSHVN